MDRKPPQAAQGVRGKRFRCIFGRGELWGGGGSCYKDELKEYLALPQIKYKSEKDVVWWLEHQEHSSRTSR